MPELENRTLFTVISSALVWRFLLFQSILASIPFVTFVLLMLGVVNLPSHGFSFTHDGALSYTVGGILIVMSLFAFSSLFCCLGLFVSHAGREDYRPSLRESLTSPVNYSLIASINFLGLIFGVLTVFIFLGGFISGSLFPSFSSGNVGITDLKSIISSLAYFSVWAKLAVWSFLFGFSERLLPNLLNNFANQIEKPDAKNGIDLINEDNAQKSDKPS